MMVVAAREADQPEISFRENRRVVQDLGTALHFRRGNIGIARLPHNHPYLLTMAKGHPYTATNKGL